MIGKKQINHIACNERIKEQLYICSTDNYNVLFEDLVLTGCHSILIDNFESEEQKQNVINTLGKIYLTEEKIRLPTCLDTKADVYNKPGNYTIYHIALENDNYYYNYGIYANGLLVESCSKRYLKEVSEMDIID
jgi:hypothetical protein